MTVIDKPPAAHTTFWSTDVHESIRASGAKGAGWVQIVCGMLFALFLPLGIFAGAWEPRSRPVTCGFMAFFWGMTIAVVISGSLAVRRARRLRGPVILLLIPVLTVGFCALIAPPLSTALRAGLLAKRGDLKGLAELRTIVADADVRFAWARARVSAEMGGFYARARAALSGPGAAGTTPDDKLRAALRDWLSAAAEAGGEPTLYVAYEGAWDVKAPAALKLLSSRQYSEVSNPGPAVAMAEADVPEQMIEAVDRVVKSIGAPGLIEVKALKPGQSRQGHTVLLLRESETGSDTILTTHNSNLERIMVAPRGAWAFKVTGSGGKAAYEGSYVTEPASAISYTYRMGQNDPYGALRRDAQERAMKELASRLGVDPKLAEAKKETATLTW